MSLRSPHRRPAAPPLELPPASRPAVLAASAAVDEAASNSDVASGREMDGGSDHPVFDGPASGPAPVLSFDAIYESQVDFVWRSARRLGVSGAALEDVVQEVFIVVHRKLGAFEGRSSLETWLYGITLRIVRNHWRRGRRKPLGSSDEDARALDSAPISDRHRPDAVVERQRARATLQRVLDELPDDLREVLVMTELEGMSGPDIAAITGVKVATVYGRLKTARAKFNSKLMRHAADDRSAP